MVSHEADAVDLDLGPLEDLDHDLGIAGIAAFEQGDRGQVVALLDIEPLNLRDRQPGSRGIRPVAGLQLGRILDLLQANGLPPSELDLGQAAASPAPRRSRPTCRSWEATRQGSTGRRRTTWFPSRSSGQPRPGPDRAVGRPGSRAWA